MTLRDRPDPGPRCDPADVEIWEQLQRALTKLDLAEQREEELRRERDEALTERDTLVERSHDQRIEIAVRRDRAEQAEAQLEQAKEERDEAIKERSAYEMGSVTAREFVEQRERAEQAEAQLEQVRGDLKGTEAQWTATERKLEDCETQRDALAEAATLSVELIERLLRFVPDGDALKTDFIEKLALARSALDALDQTNREGIQ